MSCSFKSIDIDSSTYIAYLILLNGTKFTAGQMQSKIQQTRERAQLKNNKGYDTKII